MPPRINSGQAAVWANSERCRLLLRDVAQVLAPDVQLMAMKGIYIAFEVATHPWLRPNTDADALVIGGSYREASQKLRRQTRWHVHVQDSISIMVQDRVSNAAVDLHRSPLPMFIGNLRVTELRRRARPARAGLGTGLWVPDPDDAATIAVAHFVKNRMGLKGQGRLDEDLTLLFEHANVTPRSLAERLANCDLRRTGLVAFAELATRSTRWREWFEACAPSAFERRWAEATATALRWAAPRNRALGFLLYRSIADSPSRAAAGIVGGAVQRLPYVLRGQ